MSRSRLTVVLSQAAGKHPAKRGLEEAIVAALLMEPGIDVSIIPNLYDLGPDHTGRLFLDSVKGDLVLLTWLYPRAAFWLLDRDGIRGKFGEVQLKPPTDDIDEEGKAEAAEQEKQAKGIGPQGEVPNRYIYCIDLRDFNKHEPYLGEVRRIAQECATRKAAEIKPSIVQLGLPSVTPKDVITPNVNPALEMFSPEALLAPANRRWYPVIDYSRCTNCLECLDFCLFGVYNVTSLEQIIVENQDNCKKGCPACSRVCPEQAIIFPEYKSAAIAGADTGTVGNLKIDLTKLFGGEEKDSISQAVAERDRELVADGRDAVGMSVGIPKRQTHLVDQPKDDLDKLMDDLDALGI